LPKGVVILASISYILLLFAVHWQRQDPWPPQDQQPNQGKGPCRHVFLPQQDRHCDRAGSDPHGLGRKAQLIELEIGPPNGWCGIWLVIWLAGISRAVHESSCCETLVAMYF
jgi:hypothetical protein